MNKYMGTMNGEIVKNGIQMSKDDIIKDLNCLNKLLESVVSNDNTNRLSAKNPELFDKIYEFIGI